MPGLWALRQAADVLGRLVTEGTFQGLQGSRQVAEETETVTTME